VLGHVAVVLAIAAPVSAKDTRAPVSVYIGAPTQGGFIETTQDVADSIQDLGNRLKGTDGITLVDRLDQADVRIYWRDQVTHFCHITDQ
jgi:hypothetical protein